MASDDLEDELMRMLAGEIVEDDLEMSLAELCQACGIPGERVFELVEEGVVEPLGRDPGQWRFQGVSVWRVRRAQRLQRDLGINTAGVALALDLLEELRTLRARLQRLEG